MRNRTFPALFGALALGLVLIATPALAADAAKPKLLDADCVKCHDKPPADIAAAGGQHKDVSCQECHAGHRPASKSNIPKCDDCHSGKAHYKQKSCLECHKNPHTPLTVTLAKNLTEPCLSCHTPQIAQLKEFKSKHTLLACTQCHDVHRKIPACVSCHKVHGTTMTQADCKKCHRAHKPTVLTYDAAVPNKDCAACHAKAMTLVTATATKHKTVTCVACHKDKHKMVPACDSCHPKPHPAGILAKFPKCGDCHYIAHDLNNWSATIKKPAGPAPIPAAPAAPKP
jgi:hypothetical protein